MAATETRATTPDDLLAMPDGARFELVDGQLVERNMGAESSFIGMRLGRWLANFCEGHSLGWVFGADCGYQCFPDDPGKVRRPDASFVRLGRLPGERVPKGYLRVAPDLAVEVISPNDLAAEIDEKVEEYLAAGVRLVWVANPEVRAVTVFRGDGTARRLRGTDTLDGEDVLPGFAVEVAELFRPPPGADRAG